MSEKDCALSTLLCCALFHHTRTRKTQLELAEQSEHPTLNTQQRNQQKRAPLHRPTFRTLCQQARIHVCFFCAQTTRGWSKWGRGAVHARQRRDDGTCHRIPSRHIASRWGLLSLVDWFTIIPGPPHRGNFALNCMFNH